MKSDMATVVTRFAPSPTGFLHIGGARTALFNWLFAKHYGGKFLLRIEDTDRARSTDANIKAIIDGMTWLGLNCDGEPISQFARADRHREVAMALLNAGHAYKCYATSEELAELREASRAAGTPMRGDIWRDKGPDDAPKDTPAAIRLKMPREGTVTIHDAVQGEVTVSNEELDDMVLLRSDGTPTYMLAVVVDDHDMGVTHIIRGNDHLNNAFRQYQLYQAMGWDVPIFAHIPLIHGPDGKKLSKRHGAMGVDAYRDMGYLADALKNYLARLGWGHGDDEIFSMEDAIKWFSLDHVVKGPARFDFDKLDNINGHYMREADDAFLYTLIKDDLAKKVGHALSKIEEDRIIKAMPSLKDRAKKLPELVDYSIIFTECRPVEMDEKSESLLTPTAREMLGNFALALENVNQFDHDNVKEAIKDFCQSEDIKMGALMQPIRAALTGGRPSGDLIDIILMLEKTETIKRIKDVVK